MRKAFNFYRSYYDVALELPTKDRLPYLMAILDKQFEGIEPDLNGMASFAYKSQKHSIDSQVSGYETKTKTKLVPSVGARQGASVQEKGKGEEEVEYTKGKHLFKSSKYFNKTVFHEALVKTDFGVKDIDHKHYYDSLVDWSEGGGNMKKDWIATARAWIRRDIREKKLVIMPAKYADSSYNPNI